LHVFLLSSFHCHLVGTLFENGPLVPSADERHLFCWNYIRFPPSPFRRPFFPAKTLPGVSLPFSLGSSGTGCSANLPVRRPGLYLTLFLSSNGSPTSTSGRPPFLPSPFQRMRQEILLFLEIGLEENSGFDLFFRESWLLITRVRVAAPPRRIYLLFPDGLMRMVDFFHSEATGRYAPFSLAA